MSAPALNESDTPRTDALRSACYDLSVHGHIYRMTEFARTLERELQTSEARRIGAIESLKEHIDIARAAIRDGGAPTLNENTGNWGLVQDMFDGAVRKAFPNASTLDLYGSSITFTDSTIVLRCAGEEVVCPL